MYRDCLFFFFFVLWPPERSTMCCEAEVIQASFPPSFVIFSSSSSDLLRSRTKWMLRTKNVTEYVAVHWRGTVRVRGCNRRRGRLLIFLCVASYHTLSMGFVLLVPLTKLSVGVIKRHMPGVFVNWRGFGRNKVGNIYRYNNRFSHTHFRFQFLKVKYLEEYMVLNMKTGNGKVGRIEN